MLMQHLRGRDPAKMDDAQDIITKNAKDVREYKERRAIFEASKDDKSLGGLTSEEITNEFFHHIAQKNGNGYESFVNTEIGRKVAEASGRKNLTGVDTLIESVIGNNVREIYESYLRVYPEIQKIRCETAKNEVPVVASTTGRLVRSVVPGADNSAGDRWLCHWYSPYTHTTNNLQHHA